MIQKCSKKDQRSLPYGEKYKYVLFTGRYLNVERGSREMQVQFNNTSPNMSTNKLMDYACIFLSVTFLLKVVINTHTYTFDLDYISPMYRHANVIISSLVEKKSGSLPRNK